MNIILGYRQFKALEGNPHKLLVPLSLITVGLPRAPGDISDSRTSFGAPKGKFPYSAQGVFRRFASKP